MTRKRTGSLRSTLAGCKKWWIAHYEVIPARRRPKIGTVQFKPIAPRRLRHIQFHIRKRILINFDSNDTDFCITLCEHKPHKATARTYIKNRATTLRTLGPGTKNHTVGTYLEAAPTVVNSKLFEPKRRIEHLHFAKLQLFNFTAKCRTHKSTNQIHVATVAGKEASEVH